MSAELQQPNTPKRDKAYDLSSFKVLIVEDYAFIADLLSSSLSEMGVGKVTTAAGISAGKEKILNANAVTGDKNIDIIVLDWLMPDGTGLELLQWIRNHRSNNVKYLPVVICSAYVSAELATQSRDNGANEVMVKPVSADKLAKRLLYVIDRPRPFLKTPDYFGPDRRRKAEKFIGEDKRKMKPGEIQEHHETNI